MDLDLQFYEYSENCFSNLRYQDTKNSWAIPSDGSMESNEEYFWANPIKLPLGTPKQYINSTEVNESIKFGDQASENRKRKFYSNGDGTVKKIQVVEAMKDVLSLSANNNLVQKQSIDKRDQVQNGARISTWTEDLTDNLAAEFNGTFNDLSTGNYNVNDALLSLPSLTVFKQEAPSPTSNDNQLQSIKNSCQSPVIGQNINAIEYPDSNSNQNSINTALQNLLGNGYNELQSPEENGGIDDSPSSQDINRNVVTSSDLSEDCRFQYVLAAATSIATKVNEDTLTYLNQGQSYEIKLKKLGDLSNYRGRILKSVIRICFYERRLQYMEKEQMSLWQSSRPGDRIVEVDVPLSYGLREVTQPPGQLNAVHFQWDPTKEVGVYIKVNCISTEFTPKKHGGEKGVPFRIQVETYLMGDSLVPPKRLHAAACQIKVFKLKGADRKHKQDREKIMKRPLSEQEKYQRSYECTVLNDIPSEVIVSSPLPAVNGVTSTVPGPYSPEGVSQNRSDFIQKIDDCANGIGDTGTVALPRCPSNSNHLLQENQADDISNLQAPSIGLNCDFTVQQTSQWLSYNRFGNYLQTFAGFSGADMLRMTKDDLMQICGQADGIRLFNSLHSKSITPKLTLYVRRENASIFHAVYLMSHTYLELIQKLSTLIGIPREHLKHIYYQGPHGIHVLMNDDVIKHFKEESMFLIEMINDSNSFAVILKPIVK